MRVVNITWSQAGRGRATRCLAVDTTRAASSPASGTIWPHGPGGGEKVHSASIIHQHNILPHTGGVSQTFATDYFFFHLFALTPLFVLVQIINEEAGLHILRGCTLQRHTGPLNPRLIGAVFAGIDFFIVAEVTDGGCPTLIHSISKVRIFNLKANTVQIIIYKIIQIMFLIWVFMFLYYY